MTDFNLIFQYVLTSPIPLSIRHQFCCSFYSLVIHIILNASSLFHLHLNLRIITVLRSKKFFKYKQERRNWVSMYTTESVQFCHKQGFLNFRVTMLNQNKANLNFLTHITKYHKIFGK